MRSWKLMKCDHESSIYKINSCQPGVNQFMPTWGCNTSDTILYISTHPYIVHLYASLVFWVSAEPLKGFHPSSKTCLWKSGTYTIQPRYGPTRVDVPKSSWRRASVAKKHQWSPASVRLERRPLEKRHHPPTDSPSLPDSHYRDNGSYSSCSPTRDIQKTCWRVLVIWITILRAHSGGRAQKFLATCQRRQKNTNGAEHICNLLRMLLLSPHGKLQWGPKGHTSNSRFV